MLLNIPPQKTLLRRHLATNFNTLVGSQAQQEKQEYLESSGYTPLNTTAKVRVRNRRFVLGSYLLWWTPSSVQLNEAGSPDTRKYMLQPPRFLFNLSWCSTCVLTLLFRLVHLDQMCWASAPTVCNTLTKHNEALDETCPSSFRQLSYPFIFLITERVCLKYATSAEKCKDDTQHERVSYYFLLFWVFLQHFEADSGDSWSGLLSQCGSFNHNPIMIIW